MERADPFRRAIFCFFYFGKHVVLLDHQHRNNETDERRRDQAEAGIPRRRSRRRKTAFFRSIFGTVQLKQKSEIKSIVGENEEEEEDK